MEPERLFTTKHETATGKATASRVRQKPSIAESHVQALQEQLNQIIEKEGKHEATKQKNRPPGSYCLAIW